MDNDVGGMVRLRTCHVAGLVVALSAISGIAEAGTRKSTDSPQLIRCTVQLTGPAEFAVSVSGWGSDGGEAMNAAESAARYLAEMNRMVEGWPAVLFPSETPTEGGGTDQATPQRDGWKRVRDVWLTARGDDEHRVPGYTLVGGECETVTLPKNRRLNWEASWGTASIDGDYLGPTIERARRRSCGRAYQRKRMTLFQSFEKGLTSKGRFDGLQSGLNVAYKQLEHCYTADNTLTFGAGNRRRSTPDLMSSVYVCIGEPPGMDVGGVPMRLATPAGVAGTVEGAAENAWGAWR